MFSMSYQELVEEYSQIMKLRDTSGLLGWDERTKMPDRGLEMRSEQNSAMSEVIYDRITSEKIAKLIEEADSEELTEEQKAAIREIKRDHERSKKVPRELVSKLSKKRSETEEAWRKAREEEDFSVFEDQLREMVNLQRRYAEEIDEEEEPYKVLYRDYEPYFPLEDMAEMIDRLKEELSDMVEDIRKDGRELNTSVFEGDFSMEKQEELSRDVLGTMCFDFERGRLDVSEHPFTTGTQVDTRITTRFKEDNLLEAVKIALHEGGHALYQQGLPENRYSNPLAFSRELGVHESQSRLYENHVGGSRQFMEYIKPVLEDYFPDEFADASIEEMYQSRNQVKTDNLIRVNADELTYHLHIAVRFDIGRKLINGEIEVEELPETWNQKMEEYLGLEPETVSEGVLQDVHWAAGNFGYFPTYTLGSVLAAQVYRAAEESIDGLDEKISDGELEELRTWLKENVHSNGRRFKTSETIKEATGEEPTADYFLEYAEDKYGDLYDI